MKRLLLALGLLACAEPTPMGPSGRIASSHQNSTKTVAIVPDSVQVAPGATAQLTCQPRNSNGQIIAGRKCKWQSLNPAVVVIGPNDYVVQMTITGKTAGVGRVWAQNGGHRDTAVVVVASLPPPPPPPPPGEGLTRGCPASGYLRLVNVSTEAQLASAASAALPGDQIRIAPGTYAPATEYRFAKSGTAANPITVCGMPGAMPVIKSTGDMTRFSGAYQRITGIVFEGPDGASSSNVVIIQNTHHVVFTGNECREGKADACLSLAEWNNVEVSYNYIHDSGTDESTDHCIYAKKTTGGGNKIIHNLIARCAARGISMHYNQATSQSDGVLDVLVAHNTIVYNGSQGIKLHQGDRDTVVNNLVAFNGDDNNQSQINVEVAGVGHGTHSVIKNNLTWSPTASRAGIQDEVGVIKSGNIVADPLLVGTTDWHLQAASPAIGLGLPAFTQSPDYDGVARDDGAPDAGAFER